MSEIRQNPATKEWVIIATERVNRPEDFVDNKEKRVVPDYIEDCPFCPGNEKKTPPEVFSNRDDEGKWTLRVVPNKFPALLPRGGTERQKESDFFRSMAGLGRHEVIIESPHHNVAFGGITNKKAHEIVSAYRDRYRELTADDRFKLVKIFRNFGGKAGTSLEHPHSQIVAVPVVPLHIRHRIEAAITYYDDHGKCVFCRMNEMEMKEKERLVMEDEGFIVFEPFASRTPFETWVVPKRHQATFGEINQGETRGLARVLNKVLRKINDGLRNPAYNLVVRTAPSGEEGEEYYHWHIQIIPRITTPAGFELGTGMYINTSLPEKSAEFLRSV